MEEITLKLNDSEARELREIATERHNQIARQQRDMFGDSAQLSEHKEFPTDTAVAYIVKQTLSEE